MRQFIYLTALSMALFLACTPATDGVSESRTTLKDSALRMENSVEWTNTLESDDQSEESDTAQRFKISDDVMITPLSLSVSRLNFTPSYPSFTDGFSLDTRGLNADISSLISSFLDSYSAQSGYEQYFSPESIYTLVLFSHDLNELGFQYGTYMFGEPFSQENFYQCPVRLFSSESEDKSEYIDVYIYVSEAESEWHISQIEIFNIKKE